MATGLNAQPRTKHLVLAGGGHTHALVLKRWAMQPHRRPSGLITLINRQSTTLYSGMLPGLIAGLYEREEISIDLRRLANEAGVAFTEAEITGLDTRKKLLLMEGRPPICYDILSLNIGGITPHIDAAQTNQDVAIKPLEPALRAIERSETSDHRLTAFQIIGSGLGAIELALALRHRWPTRQLLVKAHPHKIHDRLKQGLTKANITLKNSSTRNSQGADFAQQLTPINLHCTGVQGPSWMATSGLPVDANGRVRTSTSLEIAGHPGLFAAGDCAVIDDEPRPPSGVWAVRAAPHLARNLEAIDRGHRLQHWKPQRWALQLIGGFQNNSKPTAWVLWGSLLFGPHAWLWHMKQIIDQYFIASFKSLKMHGAVNKKENAMLCRGCAAKIAAQPLEEALRASGLSKLGSTPEDASRLPNTKDHDGQPVLQSLDGFPALISDPWLNARITTLHACSDLWACGATVKSAQAIVTLPLASPKLQKELLTQTLLGVKSALDPQGSQLIGGHTLEARQSTEAPLSLGIQLALTVQGSSTTTIWSKRGIQSGDQLLLSRPLGTGVLFAAAMAGELKPHYYDQALKQMATSQAELVSHLHNLEKIYPESISAATDITGFGLLGHLLEMLNAGSTNKTNIQVQLDAKSIPSLPGAIALLEKGFHSSLSPANRRAWTLLDPSKERNKAPLVEICFDQNTREKKLAFLELIIDPQTCGPLLISIKPQAAEELLRLWPYWHRIGQAEAL